MSDSKKRKKDIYVVVNGKKVLNPELAKHITKVVRKYNDARRKPIK